LLRRAALALALILGGALIAPAAWGEAYIAVREGYKCSQCHFNKTGGGKRNDFANTYVQTRLARSFVKWLPPGEEAGESAVGNIYHGRLNDFVSIGADFRFAYSERRVPHTSPTERDTSIRGGLLYLQMDMVPERASLYLDQTVQGTSTARELFVLFDNLPADSYLKLGRFFLASGFRLQDDTAFIRQYSGFTYGNPDSGIEYGLEPGPFSISLWSTSNDAKHGIIASAIFKMARIGISLNTDTTVEATRKNVGNIFAGLHMGRFTVLGELDQMVTKTSTTVTSLASLLEVDTMLGKGANLKLVDEVYDPDTSASSDRVERVSLVFEPFLTQFLQVSLGGRNYVGQTNNDQENRKEYFLEVHVFFY
jgi:hypothetical protein